MFLHRGPQAVHGSIKMGWRQIAAHHFIAQKHAVGGEHIGQAVIRHFGQPAGCHISLDLATVDAPDLYRNDESALLEALRFSSMRVPRPRQQRLCQQRNVIRPISSGPRLAGAGLRERAASQHGHAPAHRDGGAPLSSTEQRPADRCVGVGIAPFADRLDERIFNWRATREVAERIMKCNHGPPLLTHEVIWTMAEPCESQTIPHRLGLRLLHSRFGRRQQSALPLDRRR
jgi:hypothetical protein